MPESKDAPDLGALLLEVLAQCPTVIIHFDGAQYTLSADRQGHSVTICGLELDQIVLALLGRQRSRRCSGCKLLKPLSSYPRDESRSGGRSRYCRICERRRRK